MLCMQDNLMYVHLIIVSTKEFCNVISLLLNLFAARLHYLSKNHAKNQKKWFSKQNEGGHRSREVI